MSTGAAEAARQLSLAERALSQNDFPAAKRHAELAIDADPLVNGVDEILAVADVLLAAKHRLNNHPNHYSVLLLPSQNPKSLDAAAIARSFRRLTLLLSPSQNPKSQAAARLVADAYAVLSDPNKRSLFDAELDAEANPGEKPVDFDPFWTACVSCFRVFLYDREYVNCLIRCDTCKRPFTATELSVPPKIVPGTDSYYCSWGFYPLGYPGGPEFKCPEGVGVEGFGKEWNAFYQIVDNPKSMDVDKEGNIAETPKNGRGRKRTKTVVRRNLRGGMRKPQFSSERSVVDAAAAAEAAHMGEEMVEVGGIDVNFATGEVNVNSQFRGSSAGGGGVGGLAGRMPFQVEMDAATDEILDSYRNLHFMKDDIRLRMMP